MIIFAPIHRLISELLAHGQLPRFQFHGIPLRLLRGRRTEHLLLLPDKSSPLPSGIYWSIHRSQVTLLYHHALIFR